MKLMNTKNATIGVLVVAVVIFGWLSFRTKNTTTQIVTQDGKVVNVGSVSSPDIVSPYISVNGVPTFYTRLNITGATSTPCSIQSPAATSTLVFSSLQITTGSSTASTWTVATSTSRYATTSTLARGVLASGKQGSFSVTASTTNSLGLGLGANLLAPNTYVVWSGEGYVIGDSDVSATKFLGTCQASFLVL